MVTIPDFAPLAIMGMMLFTVGSVLKHVRAKQYNDVLTIVIMYAAAFGLSLIARASDFGSSIAVGASSLADVNVATVAFFAFALLAAGRTIFVEGFKAIDTARSSAEPKLVPPPVME